MAREWDEPRGRDDDRRDWRRPGRPEDPGRHARDAERQYDTPSRGAFAAGADDDFGYERQAGDYRGRGGYAPRSEMDPQFRRDFGGQDFGTHDPNRFEDDGRRPMRREFDDRDRGVRDPRPVRGGGRHGSEMGVDYDRYAGQGGYGGRAGLGSGYLGRGYTGEGERDWRDRPRHRHDPRERSLWDRTTDEVSSWFGDAEAQRRRDTDLHVGRGPKNYKRSDSRITEDINDRLSDDPYLDASDLEVRVQNGEATIDGTVDSRASKRRAEDIVESVSGVTHCQNNLRVRQAVRDEPAAETGSTSMGATLGNGGAPDRQRH